MRESRDAGHLSFRLAAATTHGIIVSRGTRPFGLRHSRHHIELLAAGLQPLAFDVDVVAGEVLPFEGTLRL